jgi:dienelactone hydrolase
MAHDHPAPAPAPSESTVTGRRGRRLLLTAAACALALPTVLPGGPVAARPALAAVNPYERGPAPTPASVAAVRGPFATAQVTVARSAVDGFGGGTIYYPTDTTAGTFGAVAVAPGFTASQTRVAWYGPRLASQGFVVFTIDTLGTLDQPDSRGAQLLAALDHLTARSTVRTRVDATRLGVMGHSMGGGGSLVAASTRPALQAAIPLNPYHSTRSFPRVTVPTLVIGSENDTTAAVRTYAEPMFTSLPASTDKAYLELDGAGHSTPTNGPDVTIATYSIAWLKRFIDDDVRYDRFLCPAPRATTIEEYRDTCPHS